MFLNSLFKNVIRFLGLYLIINLLEYLYNKPELTNSNLYFLEISFAAVLLPLADSPSQAMISFLGLLIIKI